IAPEKVVRDLSDLVGLPQYLRAQGIEAGTTVLGTRVIMAGDELAGEMQIGPEAWIFVIERLRLANGLPFSLETVRFPAELFPGLLDQSLVGSLYELLESDYQIQRGEAIETITAVAAERAQAAALQVAIGTPLLAVRRTATLTDGRIFEYSHEVYRADHIAITVHAPGSDAARRHLT
ncbi:MAG: GntR family transcriptional regulator, partial [Nocardioidaceae bacterium]